MRVIFNGYQLEGTASISQLYFIIIIFYLKVNSLVANESGMAFSLLFSTTKKSSLILSYPM